MDMDTAEKRSVMNSKKGFTLIELLTVIALLAILSSVAIPNLIGVLPKNRLGGSAREILSTLHFAKMAAIKENSTVVVRFNPASDDCIVFVDDGEGGGAADDGLRTAGERILKHSAMPPGVNLLSPSFGNVLSFNSRGFADSTGEVTVQNSAGNRKIGVLPSGHCRIL
jgi:type IV fimbrial biogenesis protein FimT